MKIEGIASTNMKSFWTFRRPVSKAAIVEVITLMDAGLSIEDSIRSQDGHGGNCGWAAGGATQVVLTRLVFLEYGFRDNFPTSVDFL